MEEGKEEEVMEVIDRIEEVKDEDKGKEGAVEKKG